MSICLFVSLSVRTLRIYVFVVKEELIDFESHPDVAEVCAVWVVLVLLMPVTTVVLSMFAAFEDATTAMRRQKADDVHNNI